MYHKNMSTDEMRDFIRFHIEYTHNEKDKEDLLTFTDEEIVEIYNDLKECLI